VAARAVLASHCADDTSTDRDDPESQLSSPTVLGVRERCAEVAAALPADYSPTDVCSRLQRLGALQPLHAFLRREIDRMQAVISTVRDALRDLLDADVDDDVLAEVFDAVRDARVPPAWTKVRCSHYTVSNRYFKGSPIRNSARVRFMCRKAARTSNIPKHTYIHPFNGPLSGLPCKPVPER